MPDKTSIHFLCDAHGTRLAAVVPVDIWERLEPFCKKLLPPEQQAAALSQQPGPLADFDELLSCWDFPYAYSPEVCCPHCGASTKDWRSDEKKFFLLKNANIGGLLVFHCTQCGTTIRQKHFRDHVAFEHTTPRPGS